MSVLDIFSSSGNSNTSNLININKAPRNSNDNEMEIETNETKKQNNLPDELANLNLTIFTNSNVNKNINPNKNIFEKKTTNTTNKVFDTKNIFGEFTSSSVKLEKNEEFIGQDIEMEMGNNENEKSEQVQKNTNIYKEEKPKEKIQKTLTFEEKVRQEYDLLEIFD